MAFSTLLDLAAANGSDGDKLLVSELIKRSDLLKVMQFRPISGASTTGQVIDSRPTASTRGFNEGVDPVAIGRSNRTWKTANFEEHSNVDVFLANSHPASAGGPQQYRADEDMEILRAITLQWEYLAFYGDQSAVNTDFDGMSLRLNDLSQDNVVGSTGGSGNNTSVYFFSLGNRSLQGTYNENSSAFPEMIDNGRVSDVEDANGKKFTAYQSIFLWQAGMRIDDVGTGRLANIKPGATSLLDNMDAVAINMKIPPTGIITSRVGLQELNKYKTSVLQSTVVDEELKRRVTTWNGLPILISDSISSSETAVT